MTSKIHNAKSDRPVRGRLLGAWSIWSLVVLVAGLAAFLLNMDAPVLGIALAGLAPVILSLFVLPAAHRDWGQGVILVIWTGAAVMACLVAGIWPLGLMFIIVPALALLFARARVVEAFVLAALAFGAIYLASRYLDLPVSPLSEAGQDLLTKIGLGASLGLLIASMIGGAGSRQREIVIDSPAGTGVRWREGLSGGMLEFDERLTLVAANAQARHQFGLNGRDKGLTLDDLTGGDDPSTDVLRGALSDARRDRASKDVRLHLGPNGADAASMDVRLTPVSSGGVLIHAIDRSDEEARIEALRRSHTVAQREAEDKTLFFAGVSHELRTPLNAIIGFSDMMRSRLFGPLPGKYAEYADLIHDSGQYMLDLIGDVLDLSKVEAGRYDLSYDTFDAADVVRSSVKMIRPASDAAKTVIDIDLPDEDALLVTADRKAVRQILLNLLSNAVKFSPQGGRIGIAASAVGSHMVLSVSDQGPGMSELEIARIGEPFAQGPAGQSTDARGSGLGLSLVKSLTELHGGSLQLKSQPGEGTLATVRLPIEGQG